MSNVIVPGTAPDNFDAKDLIGSGHRAGVSKEIREQEQVVERKIQDIRKGHKEALETSPEAGIAYMAEKREELDKLTEDATRLDAARQAEEVLERYERAQNQQEENGRRKEAEVIDAIGRFRGERDAEQFEMEIRGHNNFRNELRQKTSDKKYRQAFWQAVIAPEHLNSEELDTLREVRSVAQSQTQEADAPGGFLVPEEWARGIHQYAKSFGGIFETPHSTMNLPHGRDVHMIFAKNHQVGGEILAPQNNADAFGFGISAYGAADATAHPAGPAVGQAVLAKDSIGERIEATAKGALFEEKIYKAHLYSTQEVEMPLTLLQDEVYGIQRYMTRLLGDRLGRLLAWAMTMRGMGSAFNQPEALMRGISTQTFGKEVANTSTWQTSAAVNVAASNFIVSAAAAGIRVDDLLDMVHSVDPAYRRGSSVGWMFNDDTLRKLRGLTVSQDGSTDQRFIWQGSTRVGEPSRILGYPYYISMEMDSFGETAVSAAKSIYANGTPDLKAGAALTNVISNTGHANYNKDAWRFPGVHNAETDYAHPFMVFGDFSEWMYRTVPGFRIRRLNELAAKRNAVQFLGFGRWGAGMMISWALKGMYAKPA